MKVASVTMKALMRKRITSTPLKAPASAPKPIAIRSVSQGASSSPDAEPRLAASQAASIAVNPITDSTDRSMCPAMMQNDRPIAMMPDEGGVLQDVDEDADLEEAIDGERQHDQEDREDQPHQVIQERVQQRGTARREGWSYAVRASRHARSSLP